ncbi:MAG: pitrilysin family protein [bacterium]|nr:pitrilysin family protein [bacterium]
MIKSTKLKNGMNLITIPSSGTKAVTALVMFPVGSRFEDKRISGISHFVEHMMFKGTAKRPDYLEVSRELDAVGAEYNAFTNKDYTGYYVKVDSTKANLAFDLLSDIVFNSKIEAVELEKEKGVIVEELRMYDDNPTMAVDQLFDRTIFADHPLGRDIAGTAETVRGMTRDDMWTYYKKYYDPANAVLVIAGNIDKKKLKKYLAYFSVAKSDQKKKNGFKKFEKYNWSDKPLSERVAVKESKLDQAHLIMGFPGLAYKDKKSYTAAVMLCILGGGMSSRLFVEVREKRGLAYMVRAGAGSYLDCGVVQIQSGLDPVRLNEALATIKSELNKIASVPVSKKELQNAKNSLIGRLALALEDSSTQAERTAKQFWFLNKLESFEEVKRKINAVEIKGVQSIAKQFFDWKKMHLAVIGSVKKEDIIKML